MQLIEITIDEFKKDFYDKYISLFPDDEQRDLKNIRKTYEKGIEKFYKIVVENQAVGFFMLEKIDDNYPYYLDYFGIFKEFQDKGYGTEAIKVLLRDVIRDKGLCGEIGSVDYSNNEEEKKIRKRRAKFWESLGLKEVDSRYSMWKVVYTPYIYYEKDTPSKEKIDKIMFDYYIINSSKELVEKNGYKIY